MKIKIFLFAVALLLIKVGGVDPAYAHFFPKGEDRF